MTTLLTRWRSYRTPSPTATVDPSAASAAACAAQVLLAEERTRAADTTKVVESLRDLRARNHFADLWVEAARPKRAS